MTKTQRLAIILTVINLALLILVLTNDNAALAKEDVSILRGRGLELVDEAGQVRASFVVEDDGEAVFRMRDGSGAVRVKLGAGNSGSGLVLMNEATEPGVQILARGAGTSDRPTATSISLLGVDGKKRVIEP